ncbi:MAG: PBP1A family penicillin-binding protein [Candidatus Sumerlaeia bacterium]
MNEKQAEIQQNGISPRRRRRRLWMWAFLLVAGFTTMFSAIAVGVFIGILRELPPLEALEDYDPPQVSHVYDRSGAIPIGAFRSQDQRRQVVTYDEIPANLRNAFIAIEDNRFFEHFGVDIFGVARAVITDIRTRSLAQGASTITMQLTKNILGDTEKTAHRKIKEAVLALEIERRYSKPQILEFYLNHIAFGGINYGVSAAANAYFSKPLGQLTLAECATLAAIPKAPTTYNPRRNPAAATERRNLVLYRMYQLDMIDEEQYEAARNEPLRANPGQQETSRYPYFLDAVYRELTGHLGMNRTQLTEGGLRITTTIDPQVQEVCEKELREGLVKAEAMWARAKPGRHGEEMKDWNGTLKAGDTILMEITAVKNGRVSVELDRYRGSFELPEELPYYNPKDMIKAGKYIDVYVEDVAESGRITCKLGDRRPIQGSIVVLDAHNGEVLGLVGGTNFYNKQWDGEFNRAVQARRQVGSCFKPFFYAAAFEKGFSPADMIVDEPVEYDNIPKPYRPVNYEHDFEGPMTLIKALEHSRNVVAIRLFEAVGASKALEAVGRFDYTEPVRLWPLRKEMSLPLGTIGVSPFEIAAAYQVFANLGIGVRPQFVRSVVDGKGISPIRPKREEKVILDPVAAYQVEYSLRQVVLTGTGATPIGSKFKSPPAPPICGKTGTTNDSVDAWFVGFTPDLVIAVQVGFDSPHPMGPGMNGGPVAGPIWANVLKGVLKTRSDWRTTFEAPPGIVLANVCAATGKRAGDACAASEHTVYWNVPFRAGQEPRETCDGTFNARTPIIQPVGSEYAGYSCPVHGTAHEITSAQ